MWGERSFSVCWSAESDSTERQRPPTSHSSFCSSRRAPASQFRARQTSVRGWLALEEGVAKAALALTASMPAPREVLVAGRLASAPGLLDALAERLQGVAPVRPALAAKSAARGAALLADGLAGGSYAPLVARMRLRESRGGVLDHLRMYGADRIELG